MKRLSVSALLLSGAVAVGATACEREPRPADPMAQPSATDTAREAGRDAGNAVRGAAETIDVKAALTMDQAVDASDINVDTNGTAKVVTLKGSVATADERARAEEIAMREAPGYRIDNQLVLRAR
ncbi:MAG: BON domain-containing protein [Acidobacteria bacterium]|nr:BON domain-containing protein [Acidobacteriota bacterium]